MIEARPTEGADPALVREQAVIQGTVQGVGFRPYLHQAAGRHGLAGFVCNDERGVVVEVEGPRDRVEAFFHALAREAPPNAVVRSLTRRAVKVLGSSGFHIEASRGIHGSGAVVPPDLATCDQCLAEFLNPSDRRYGYPFLNCTQCGPRYTIVLDLPYDRAATTMADFPLCAACALEYHDPGNRRFHAQPTACAACGPAPAWHEWRGSSDDSPAADPITAASAALAAGRIVAVKGLGGFHLACDATSETAVSRLRDRKGREAKPFAVMVRDLAAARTLCALTADAETLLTSSQRPIILAPRLGSTALAPAVAPGLDDVGIFLPYTPLHHALLAAVGRPLVMTSANPPDQPLLYQDAEAITRLAPLADGLLTHNRRIHSRLDDSVARPTAAGAVWIRRARGHVPAPIELPWEAPVPLLAVGGQLKNTFTLVCGRQAYLGPHIGDLDHPDSETAFHEALEHLSRLLGITPEAVACDRHPDYRSTAIAAATGLPVTAIQHHHAHIAAVAAEHGLTAPVLGVAWDGAGFGDDGGIWGGEFLLVEGGVMERIGHLRPIPLPGGDAAVKAPWRMALAYLHALYGAKALDLNLPLFQHPRDLERKTAAVSPAAVMRLLDHSQRGPHTTSVGRLCDGMAALAGLRAEIQFEGQAAMELEALARAPAEAPYPMDLAGDDPLVLDWGPMVAAALTDALACVPLPMMAARFYDGLAAGLTAAVIRLAKRHGLKTIALGGGVFQNRRLVETAVAALQRADLTVVLARQVPPNDAGLSLGQAAVAAATLHKGG